MFKRKPLSSDENSLLTVKYLKKMFKKEMKSFRDLFLRIHFQVEDSKKGPLNEELDTVYAAFHTLFTVNKQTYNSFYNSKGQFLEVANTSRRTDIGIFVGNCDYSVESYYYIEMIENFKAFYTSLMDTVRTFHLSSLSDDMQVFCMSLLRILNSRLYLLNEFECVYQSHLPYPICKTIDSLISLPLNKTNPSTHT